jgi:hypothetical protein
MIFELTSAQWSAQLDQAKNIFFKSQKFIDFWIDFISVILICFKFFFWQLFLFWEKKLQWLLLLTLSQN